jgi:hypothetical protein
MPTLPNLCPLALVRLWTFRDRKGEVIWPHEATCQGTDPFGRHCIDLGVPSGQMIHVKAETLNREQPPRHGRGAVE